MAFQHDDLPGSIRVSSITPEPSFPDNNEELGEITVDLNTTSISPSQNSNTHTIKNTTRTPSKLPNAEAQPKRQSQRQSKRKPLYRAESSEAELGEEIQVSPFTSKSVVPAKRNRSTSTSKPTPRHSAKRNRPPIDRKMKKWEPEFVTQNAKSPLVTNGVDLRTLLLQPAAWDVLSVDDKREILSFFPADAHILDPNTPDARPNVISLSSNDTFRHDAEEYVSNIAKGMHDMEWLRQAWSAHQRRAAGDFDEFYLRKVEVDWSTDIPDEHRPEHLRTVKRGASPLSDARAKASLGEAAMLGNLVKTPEKNGASEDGRLEQNGFAKQAPDVPANSHKAHPPDRESFRDTSSPVADSITVRNEDLHESNSGPRFELIPSPAESDAEHISDQKGIADNAVNGTTHDTMIGAKEEDSSNTVEIKAANGEIVVSEGAVKG